MVNVKDLVVKKDKKLFGKLLKNVISNKVIKTKTKQPESYLMFYQMTQKPARSDRNSRRNNLSKIGKTGGENASFAVMPSNRNDFS